MSVMKYDYTWSHILLFAKVCGRIDDGDSVTASWVEVTEDHNILTFPFTLWPLTYRTCEVTTSPAMCSPIHISSDDLSCNYDVKLFKCNEVMLICFQDKPCGTTCDHPCIAEVDGDGLAQESNHVDNHSFSKTEALLPCHVAHCYYRVEKKIKDAFYQLEGNIECVICIGHGTSASMASCLASDMSRSYEAEKEFLGLDVKRVVVDFIGFSDSVVASPTYWEQCCSCIDVYISVVFKDHLKLKKAFPGTVRMIVNPRSIDVTIERSEKTLRSPSVSSLLHRMKPKTSKDISDYISALDKKINVPLFKR